MKKVWVKQDFVFNVLTLGGATGLAFYPVLGDPAFVGITLEEGMLLLVMFGVWLWYMLYRRRGIDMVDEDEESGYRTLTLSLSIIMIIAGIVGVFVGGHWVVTGGLALAGVLGLSSGLVGLTIVGIGTSLPELTVSVAAIYRRQGSIAVGNIIGSAIFDFLAIFGVAALFTPLTFSTDLQFDILITFMAAILLLGAMFVGRRYILTRWQGFLFLVVYLVYLFYILYRG
jgi:cation:H+ antiporter